MSFFVPIANVAFIKCSNCISYIYSVEHLRTILRFVIIATAIFCLLPGARAEEIRPTRQMLDSGRQMKKIEFPDDNPSSYEYHFRNLSGHILLVRLCNGR
jgi:hypothetical protein